MSFEGVKEQPRARNAHIAFLSEMHRRGAPLQLEEIALLREHNALPQETAAGVLDAAAKKVEIGALDRFVLTKDLYEERCRAKGFHDAWKDRDIEKEHWKCENPADFSPEYARWINSHFRRFCDLEAFEPFWLYKQQGDRWLAEPVPDLSTMDLYERMAFWREEFRRVSTNSYYAIERYGWYKESSLDGGEGKFVCNMAHIFLLYLIDDGRSAYIGKGRQMASTTLLMLIAAIKMIVRRNMHVKLIACDLDTTEDIFEDKLKYGFGRLEKWMKPKVINDSGKLFRVAFNANAAKGSRKTYTSKLNIVAPKVSAINGGAPDIIFIDEAVFLDFFHEMMKEGRPVLFTTVNGKLVMRRQLLAWGTGGRSAKGGGSFEREHRGTFAKWAAGNFSEGIIPVFLDWTCRPNITEEHYLKELEAYKTGEKEGYSEQSMEERITQFRQHYPSSLDDMYSIGTDTLVPTHIIIRNSDKITALPEHLRPQYGYFDAIEDKSITFPPECIMRHPVKEVQFVPMGPHEISAPVCKFMDPYPNWKDRTYQYTDPISAHQGLSRHASAIWDAHFRTVSCIVNWRTTDPYEAWKQSKLMGMYYRNHGQVYCPELIENNIGTAYIQWLQGMEWKATRSLVTNFMLPDYLQGGPDPVGIDTKAGRKREVVQLGKAMILAHGMNIFIPEFWSQLRYFTGKTNNAGDTSYQVDNRRQHQDDVVDAVFGSYVCRLSFNSRIPEQVDAAKAEEHHQKPQYRLVFDPITRTNRFVPVRQKRTLSNAA